MPANILLRLVLYCMRIQHHHLLELSQYYLQFEYKHHSGFVQCLQITVTGRATSRKTHHHTKEHCNQTNQFQNAISHNDFLPFLSCYFKDRLLFITISFFLLLLQNIGQYNDLRRGDYIIILMLCQQGREHL